MTQSFGLKEKVKILDGMGSAKLSVEDQHNGRRKFIKIKVIWFYILVILSICISCKKENETKNPCLPYSTPEYRIKQILTYQSNKYYKSEYLYDSLGRLNYRRDSSDYLNEIFWRYETDNVFMLNKDSVTYQTFHLNSQGYAMSNSGPYLFSYYNWEYDSSGYKIKETESGPHSPTYFREYSNFCWNNFDISESWSFYGQPPVLKSRIMMDYYPDKISTIGNENIGIHYLGKQNNCLVKTVIKFSDSVIDTLGIYFYEYDFLNRVVKETVKKSGENICVRTFCYYED